MSWFSIKHNCIPLSITEAEYIAAGSGYIQLIWMKNMLKDYGFLEEVLMLYYDNLSAINILKNPVHHSRTKHIDICHHHIRSLVEDKIIDLRHVLIENQLVDIFTKGLDATMHETLRFSLGLCII